MSDTTTTAVGKRLSTLRDEGGAVTMGRVLTLVVAPDSPATMSPAIDAAVAASREHPCRVIVVVPRGAAADRARLDAEIRVGHHAGAGEVVILNTAGTLAGHAANVVVPFLLPDTPVVTWWPGDAPPAPARHPLGRLAIRRITDATACTDPLAAIRGRLPGYAAGDTDLSWSRITYWRALLAAAVDQPPCETIRSAEVSGLADEPALDLMAGWLASCIDGPVTRVVGGLAVELTRDTETIALHRPQDGVTATLTRTARPDALLPLARRETRDCLAEELRRLHADETYRAALQGIENVRYPDPDPQGDSPDEQ